MFLLTTRLYGTELLHVVSVSQAEAPEFDGICGLRAALLHCLQELAKSQVGTLGNPT